MTTETLTLNPIAGLDPLCAAASPAAPVDTAMQFELSPKKPSYGYDDEEEDDGFDDEDEDDEDEEDEDDEEDDDEYSYDDEDEEYEDEEDEEEDDEEDDDDENEDEDIGYYTRPLGRVTVIPTRASNLV
jgi:hypothetical protein